MRWTESSRGKDSEVIEMQTRTEDETVSDVGEAEKGLVIERRFTSAGSDPFDAFDWIELNVEIRISDGRLAHENEGARLTSVFAGVSAKGGGSK